MISSFFASDRCAKKPQSSPPAQLSDVRKTVRSYAETVIVGLLAGILGVGVSVLLTIPITSVIQNLLGASEISASLPVTAALLLILLSVAITVIAGWIPSRRAAKKDPVAALRTE